MRYQHTVLKYIPPKKGKLIGDFDEVISFSTEYYSLGYLYGNSTQEGHIEVDTLADLWRIYVYERNEDCSIGAQDEWHYRFYKHRIIEEDGKFIDCVTPLAFFREGNNLYAKPIPSNDIP